MAKWRRFYASKRHRYRQLLGLAAGLSQLGHWALVLAKRQIKVSVALIHAVKSGKRKKRDPMADLLAARSYVRKLGNLPRARQALDALAKLQ